jgi:hypothetical protein
MFPGWDLYADCEQSDVPQLPPQIGDGPVASFQVAGAGPTAGIGGGGGGPQPAGPVFPADSPDWCGEDIICRLTGGETCTFDVFVDDEAEEEYRLCILTAQKIGVFDPQQGEKEMKRCFKLYKRRYIAPCDSDSP